MIIGTLEMHYLGLHLVIYLQYNSDRSPLDWYASVSHLHDENDESIHLLEVLQRVS